MKAKLHMKNTMGKLHELKVSWLYNIEQIHSIQNLKIYISAAVNFHSKPKRSILT